MTETTIKFENMQETEKTYRMGDKFLHNGEIFILVSSGNRLVTLANVVSGVHFRGPVHVQDHYKINLLHVLGARDNIEEFKHLEHVEIVVKG